MNMEIQPNDITILMKSSKTLTFLLLTSDTDLG